MGTQQHPSQRVEPKSEPTQPERIVSLVRPDPDTLADLVARLCRQLGSIADATDRACARARTGKDEPR